MTCDMICPFIRICAHKVSYVYYKNYCSGHLYPNCKEYNKIENDEMTPKEWHEKLRVFSRGEE